VPYGAWNGSFSWISIGCNSCALPIERYRENPTETTTTILPLASDYELIIIDNTSDDDSVLVLNKLTGENRFPNLQIFALTKEVDSDTASWVGLENALGDFVAVINPAEDDIGFLPEMLNKAVVGAEVEFAKSEKKHKQHFLIAFLTPFLLDFTCWPTVFT